MRIEFKNGILPTNLDKFGVFFGSGNWYFLGLLDSWILLFVIDVCLLEYWIIGFCIVLLFVVVFRWCVWLCSGPLLFLKFIWFSAGGWSASYWKSEKNWTKKGNSCVQVCRCLLLVGWLVSCLLACLAGFLLLDWGFVQFLFSCNSGGF